MLGLSFKADGKYYDLVESLPKPILASAVPSLVTGTLAETALASVTIPANRVGPNDIIRIVALFSVPNSANNKIIRVRLGGISGVSFYAATVTTVSSVQLEVLIRNRNSQSSQVGGGNTTTSFSISSSAVVTASVDMTLPQDIVFSGMLANVGETITLESWQVEFLSP